MTSHDDTETTTGAGALTRRKRLALFIPVALAILALDLASKTMIFAAAGARIERGATVDPGREISVIPGMFKLSCTTNTGGFSGWFSGWKGFLVAVSFIALAAIVAYVSWGRIGHGVFVLALALIAGGTAGNLYDRLVFGAVRDFFYLYKPFRWNNFNIADASLCVGIGLWLLHEFRLGKRARA
jgi:signal peptidase II